jgi:hypothetical protein
MRGRVSSFDRVKRCGFIVPEQIGRGDAASFRLAESMYAGPTPGDVVQYSEGPFRNGRIRAERVRLIERRAFLE